MRSSWPEYSAGCDQEREPAEFDFHVALESLDNDVDLLVSQMQFFLHDGQALMDQIEQAIQRQEPDRVRLASHRLKGMLARYAYHEAADVVRELERMGEAGTLDAARPLHGRLARMVHRLGGAIATDLRHHAESHGGAR